MDEQLDKSEQATPFKLDDARKKGMVGRSQELVTVTAFAVMMTVLLLTVTTIGAVLAKHFAWWLGNAHMLAANWRLLPGQISHTSHAVLQQLLFPVLLAMVAVVVVSIAHAGSVFSGFPLKPDFKRLNPAAGFKRIFSVKSLIDLGKLLLKLGVFCAVIYQLWLSLNAELPKLAHVGIGELCVLWLKFAGRIALALIVVMVFAALLDLWLSKRQFAKQMRMSQRDLKDEHKRREGDPQVRAKRKRSQMELLKKVLAMAKVPSADVLITNPTHYAVALRYRPTTMAVPEVVAMGRGIIALRIIAAARKARVPVMRKPALARLLFKSAKISQAIPASTESAVAEVYRWVASIPGNKVMSS